MNDLSSLFVSFRTKWFWFQVKFIWFLLVNRDISTRTQLIQRQICRYYSATVDFFAQTVHPNHAIIGKQHGDVFAVFKSSTNESMRENDRTNLEIRTLLIANGRSNPEHSGCGCGRKQHQSAAVISANIP